MYNKLKNKIEEDVQRIDNELWQEIKLKSQLVNIKKNEVLVNFGTRNKNVYFIASGSFVTSIISIDGDKKGVWFHLDELFNVATCVDSYFSEKTTKYEIKALEDSVVIVFNKQTIDDWASNHQLLSFLYHKNLSNDFTIVNEIRAFKLSHSAEQFLVYLNENYPSLSNRISSKNMAHFLGVSPEWYSKLKKKI